MLTGIKRAFVERSLEEARDLIEEVSPVAAVSEGGQPKLMRIRDAAVEQIVRQSVERGHPSKESERDLADETERRLSVVLDAAESAIALKAVRTENGPETERWQSAAIHRLDLARTLLEFVSGGHKRVELAFRFEKLVTQIRGDVGGATSPDSVKPLDAVHAPRSSSTVSPSEHSALDATAMDRSSERWVVPDSFRRARLIKRYPNRRLFDTVERRYIVLADVRKLIVERVEFVIIDKASQSDITRSILLQVIAEEEYSGEPIMSRDFLSLIIRSYGDSLHSMIGSYLAETVRLFVSQTRDERGRGISLGASDTEAVAGLANRNYQRWKSVQDEIYATLVRVKSSFEPSMADGDELKARRERGKRQ